MHVQNERSDSPEPRTFEQSYDLFSLIDSERNVRDINHEVLWASISSDRPNVPKVHGVILLLGVYMNVCHMTPEAEQVQEDRPDVSSQSAPRAIFSLLSDVEASAAHPLLFVLGERTNTLGSVEDLKIREGRDVVTGCWDVEVANIEGVKLWVASDSGRMTCMVEREDSHRRLGVAEEGREIPIGWVDQIDVHADVCLRETRL